MSANDIILVQQLVCREREARDRHWWDEMRQVYSPEAFINISWYRGQSEGFIQGSMQMAQRGGASYHRLGPIVVRIHENRAVATLSVSIESRMAVDGVQADLESQARLVYRAVRSEKEWKLVSLDCIYQRDTLVPALPGHHLTPDRERLMAYRSSYRCLSYVLDSKGYGVNQELPGDDRPEQVKGIYDETFAWLIFA